MATSEPTVTSVLMILSNDLLGYLLDPNKRLFWGYLVSTLAFICLYSWVANRNGQRWHWRQAFGHQVLLHPSSKLDLKIWLINIGIRIWLIAPIIVSVAPIAIAVNSTLNKWFSIDIAGNMPHFIAFVQDTTPEWLIVTFVTLLLFLLDDFSRFLLHWLMHKVPFLWAFHRVHHSAEVLTPLTVYRTHPIESLLYATRLALVNGVVLGISTFFFSNQVSFANIIGANIGVFLFNILGSNLRHSNVRLGFGRIIEKWLISPAQHQIHHSSAIEHRDKNFGTALAVWDRMFGSLVITGEVDGDIKFGSNVQDRSLSDAYFRPFKSLIPFSFK